MQLVQMSEIVEAERLIYLASPYWHEDPEVIQERVRWNGAAAEWFVKHGAPVYSPCAYTGQWQGDNLSGWSPPQGWYLFDLAFVRGAGMVMVATLPGWQQSRGVSLELTVANDQDIPVRRVIPLMVKGRRYC